MKEVLRLNPISPLIDTVFHADGRLVPISRVMFLTFIVNATALVQTNRLIKQMNVKMVAVSNVIGLVVSGALGIWLALDGYGAWAIVWQSLSLAAVKSIVLWITTGWRPLWEFSMASLRSIFKVGAGVMTGNLLNVTFQNIYSFIIGAFYNLAQLGCYTQADKWSKMGVASLSSILNTTFLPVLSGVQDDRERFYRMMSKINRLSAYMVLPCMGLLFATAPAIFHVLFQDKWDAAIVLFQLLAVRVASDILKYGKVKRGILQIETVQLTRRISSYARLDITQGLLVSKVTSGGNADVAGIMGGTEIRIIAGGPDEEQAVEELVKLVESGFAEE